MRAWATAPSQRSVPTLSMPVWPGLNDKLATVDQRLQDRHCAVIEEEGVVVVRRTTEEFDIERALCLRKTECLHERTSLQNANLEVVEGGVIIDIAGVADQTVIGNDLDTGVMRLLQHIRQGRPVDGCDHEDLHALGDHVLDLRELIGNVVFGIL